jgi:hypothetical protein
MVKSPVFTSPSRTYLAIKMPLGDIRLAIIRNAAALEPAPNNFLPRPSMIGNVNICIKPKSPEQNGGRFYE